MEKRCVIVKLLSALYSLTQAFYSNIKMAVSCFRRFTISRNGRHFFLQVFKEQVRLTPINKLRAQLDFGHTKLLAYVVQGDFDYMLDNLKDSQIIFSTAYMSIFSHSYSCNQAFCFFSGTDRPTNRQTDRQTLLPIEALTRKLTTGNIKFL